MAHLVLGYPTLEESIHTAETYIAAGVAILELQVPFSHPTADGPVITAACRVATEQQGVTVAGCLAAIRQLRDRHPTQEMIVMSYLNRVYTFGFGSFRRELNALNIRHLIVPDLPTDAVLPGENRQTASPASGGLVPVLAGNIPEARLEKLLAAGHDFFYLMSDFKITGGTFSLHPRVEQLVARIRLANPAARVGIGFGIDTPAQAQAVLALADYAIIGSALIRAKEEQRLDRYFERLRNTIEHTTFT